MTAAVVDLAAVARARAELAALVAAHPELTSPAARARLGDALPDIVEPPMTKSLDPNHVSRPGVSQPSQTVGVRLTPNLLEAVKVDTERLRSMAPGTSFGLGDGVRSLILRALSAAPSQPIAAPSAPEEPPLVRAPSMPPPPRVPAELVETEAARVDPRQLALIAEPPIALAEMPVRVMPLETVAEVRARIEALQATNPKLSNRKIGSLAGLSNAPVDKIMRGGNVRPETLARIAAILPPEHMEK